MTLNYPINLVKNDFSVQLDELVPLNYLDQTVLFLMTISHHVWPIKCLFKNKLCSALKARDTPT